MPKANVLVGSPTPPQSSAELIRELANCGDLAKHVAAAPPAECTWLYGGAYEIVWPVVWQRLTRRMEHHRGHARCARSIQHLEPECLDLFEDDVDATVTHLFRNAKVPIVNVEGWIASRLNAATVDGHRRRRGTRGASQRPRLPGWLAAALRQDPWLSALAVEILTWVGVPTTAGASVWPYASWAERRRTFTGDSSNPDAAVVRDVETVLTAMRQNPTWYQAFVERPLGHKQAALLASDGTDPDRYHEMSYLALTQRHEFADTRLLELASLAVSAIETRLRAEEDPYTVVVIVLRTVFQGSGADEMDSVPGAGPSEEERVTALLDDPVALERIVDRILAITSSQ